MIDGLGGDGNERHTNQEEKRLSTWLLSQENDVMAEDVSDHALVGHTVGPLAGIWSQYKGELPQTASERKWASRGDWVALRRGTYDNKFRVLGFMAAIMVVMGLTSLFTTSPPTRPQVAATSRILSSPSSAGVGAVPPANTPAAPESREDAAGVNPPTHVVANAPASGVEGRLLSFLEDGSGKTATFDLDRISFDVGKTTLTTSSHNQLEQLAKILNAFPGARGMIWVHSDDGRNKAQSAKLSFDRAKSVRTKLTRLGVGPSRLTSKREAKDLRSVSERAWEERTDEGQGGHAWIRVKKM